MLNDLIEQSIYILREARALYKNPVIMFAGGKDSTSLIYLAKMAYLNEIPFPVVFLDTGYQFQETYNFINRLVKMWDLQLIVLENRVAKMDMVSPETHDRVKCCTLLKSDALLSGIKENKWDLIIEGTRWDEHPVRGKRKYFVEYFSPPHTRCFPINHFSERDIWTFIHHYQLPYNPLYDYKTEDGKTFRSIGCYPCTQQVHITDKERAGRASDKEAMLEYLAKMGYL